MASGRLLTTLLVTLAIVYATSSGCAWAGELVFGGGPLTAGPDGVIRDQILLRGFATGPVTAMQFTVVCNWPYRLISLDRGADVADSSAWMFFTHVNSGSVVAGRTSSDTVRVVLLSKSHLGFTPGSTPRIASLGIRKPAGPVAGGASAPAVRILDVVGALPTGDDAGIHPGSARPLPLR